MRKREEFEFDLWQLAHRLGLPEEKQMQMVTAVLSLAEKATQNRPALIHYSQTGATGVSVCGKVGPHTRQGLRNSDPTSTTCKACMRTFTWQQDNHNVPVLASAS